MSQELINEVKKEIEAKELEVKKEKIRKMLEIISTQEKTLDETIKKQEKWILDTKEYIAKLKDQLEKEDYSSTVELPRSEYYYNFDGAIYTYTLC
jgi:DNA-directed RNA polymerase sigma subunit (sigma70/sigma32)